MQTNFLRPLMGSLAVLAVTLAVGCYGGGYGDGRYGYGYGGRGSYGSNPTAVPRTAMPVAGQADVTITIEGVNGSMSFLPNPATVRVGQKVAWHNADFITHTATADSGAFNTGGVGSGGSSVVIPMMAAGTFGYHCGIHPSMVGTLNVTP